MLMISMPFLRTITLVAIASLNVYGSEFDWEKAVSLYKQGQFQAAIVEFQAVVAEFPNHSDSWKFIGLAYFQLQDYAKAIAPLEKAISLKEAEGRSDQDLMIALTRARLSLKQYDQALPYLEGLARTRPEVAANHYMLGVAYASMNRSQDAVAAFEKSVKLAPKDGDSWHYLAIQQLRLDRTTAAIASLRSGLAVAPKSVEMSGLLVEGLLREADAEQNEAKKTAMNEEAVRVATSLKALRDDAASAELLGRASLAARKYQQAEVMLARAVSMSKEPSAALYYNLGLSQAQTKGWTRAVNSFANADRLKPNDLNTVYYLGFVYENLRQFQQALDAYTRAYDISGKNNADLKASIDRVTPFAKP